jgi:aminopeptidase N
MELLLEYFTPEHYALNLSISDDSTELTGIATITGEAKSDTIKFHAVGHNISRVTIDDQPAEYTYDDQIVTISAPKTGNLTIQIVYKAPIRDAMTGVYRSRYIYEGREEIIVATHFEAIYARHAFPCIDEPAAKATFDISITANHDYKVLSNMPALDTTTIDDDLQRVRFATTPRMSTYLVAWAVGRFNSYSLQHGDTAITTYAALNQPENLLVFPTEVAAKSLDYYAEQFDTPYPLPKLDQVALPDFDAGAMENWGLITYREACLLADANSALDTRQQVALVVAHEVSHQWFGNLVTMRWWDDLWLNESFATIMEYLAVDAAYPEFRIWQEFYLNDVVAALRRDALDGVQSVYQPVNDPLEIATLFDPAIVYAKGARLVLMLLRTIGEQNFFTALTEYFGTYAYRNTVGDDLWDIVSHHADFDVKTFMHSWIDQPGYPVITDGKARRFLIDGTSDDTAYQLPALRHDLSGHYIYNLSPDELADQLGRFSKLKLEQKLRLLNDRSLLAKTHLVSSASLLEIVQKLSRSKLYPVWDTLATTLSDIKTFIRPGTAEDELFKRFATNLTAKHAERLGLVTRPTDTLDDTQLRPIILCFSTYGNNRAVIDAAIKLFDTTSDLPALDPNTRSNIITAKVKYDETPELIDRLFAAYANTVDPDFKNDLLLALTSSRNSDTLSRVLETIRDTDIIRPQDSYRAYVFTLRNDYGTDLAIDWLFANWDFIAELCGDQDLDDYPRALGAVITTRTNADKFSDFFRPLRERPDLARAIEVASHQIAARLELIETDSTEVFAKLAEIVK